MAVANPTKPAGVPGETNEWGSTFGCFEDLAGCLYIGVCGCSTCATCEIGKALGAAPMGPKNEKAEDFMGIGGQLQNCLTIVGTEVWCLGPIIGLIACKEKCWCFYGQSILEGYAAAMHKSKKSPGPCDDACIQMMCCGPCTLCLMYRELKLKPCATPQPAPTFTEMSRT